MSDSSDTSIIDEKKVESEGGNTNDSPNYGKFLLSLFIIVFVLIYFGISSFVLYGCKIAQSNVLPTDINCYPYTDNKPDIKPVETNIFKTLFTEEPLSMKLNIPYEQNSKFSILDTIRQYKTTSSFLFINYLISIFEPLVASNFAIFNYIFNGLNKIPEIITVLLGPIILGFIIPIVMIFNCVYVFFYLWFYNMSWFFKKNTSEDTKGTPKWEDASFFEFKYFVGIVLAILFTIVLFITAPYVWFSFVSIFFVLFTIVSYTGKINNKNVDFFTIFLDVIKFYKISITTIISIFVISSAFVNLGATSGLIGLVVLFLIWYGLISVNLFKPINPENLTPVVSDEQAIKSVCTSSSQNDKKEKHGLLYNLVFGQKGGSNIAKDLKKLNKQKNK